MAKFAPFENEAQALSLDDFSIENRLDRVALFGNLDLTRDRHGLEHARRLKEVLDAIIKRLESDADLPDEIATDVGAVTGPHDPFA